MEQLVLTVLLLNTLAMTSAMPAHLRVTLSLTQECVESIVETGSFSLPTTSVTTGTQWMGMDAVVLVSLNLVITVNASPPNKLMIAFKFMMCGYLPSRLIVSL